MDRKRNPEMRERLTRRGALAAAAASLATVGMASQGSSGGAVKQAALPVFNIRDFQAAPDGKALCTQAIQAAIDACHQSGGGTVYAPPGVYLTGTLFLRSNVTLYVEAGATLLGSTRIEDYSPQSVIVARDAQNVSLTGPGTIDGQGFAFWEKVEEAALDKNPRRKFAWTTSHAYRHARRTSGRLIRFEGCSHVRIHDVTLMNSESWTVHLMGCDDVAVRGVRIRNPLHGPNTDGIDIEASQNVHVSDCDIYTADDALVIKNRRREYYKRPCKNITVTNCILTTTCNAFKIGTESNGDFENIVFSNSVIKAGLPDEPLAKVGAASIDPQHVGTALGPLGGVAVESVDGAHLRGVAISNIVMHGARGPIFIRLGHRGIDPTKKEKVAPGALEDVSISHVVAYGASTPSAIAGIPGHLIRNVVLNDVRITTLGGGGRELAGREVPEKVDSYPEVTMWGTMPCHGLFCRHVEGLLLRDLRVFCEKPDARPALIFEDIEGLRVEGLELDKQVKADSLVELRGVRDAVVRSTVPPRGARTWVRVTGKETKNILLLPDALRERQKPFEAGEGVDESAIVLRTP